MALNAMKVPFGAFNAPKVALRAHGSGQVAAAVRILFVEFGMAALILVLSSELMAEEVGIVGVCLSCVCAHPNLSRLASYVSL